MSNWKEGLDDEGRSFVEFLREHEDKIMCVVCSKPIADKVDFNVIENIYSHTRSIEHGFKMFIMVNLELDVVDLTNSDDRENWSPKPKQKNVEITCNADGTLKISGVNPIKYVVPINDLQYMKKKMYESETSRKTVLTSLDNYVNIIMSPSKRKQTERGTDSSEQNSSVSLFQKTSPKKRKTSQLTLARWLKNDQRQQKIPHQLVDPSLSESPQDIPQQQDVTQISTLLSEGLTRINEVRPAKRGISQIIRARVVIKSDIHPFFNFLGPTTMFTLDLIDESGEIRLSAFGASVNKLYHLVEVGRIYYFSRFKVKVSDHSKKPVISEYNITCTDETIIRPYVLTSLEMPKLKFHFKPISTVQNMHKDDVIDVLAIIEKFSDVVHKKLSSGSAGRSRGIWLVDQSKTKILLYLWGTNADNFERNRPGDVIAVKRAKVKTYAKLNLDSSCLSSSTFEINPQLPEADALRKWYNQNGKCAAIKVLSGEPRPKKISGKSVQTFDKHKFSVI